jgi:ribokinase
MIVVFGSLNMDMVMQLEKLPRPGDTVLCPSYQLIPGGKGGNQAVAAAKAGAQVKLFSKIGNDEFGRMILDSLKTTNVELMGVTQSPSLPTGCAIVSVDGQGENQVTVATGANLENQEAEIPDFLLAKGNTLVLQMETSVEENWKLIRRAKKYGARIILNLAPAHSVSYDILDSLDVLVLNQSEAAYLGLHLGFDVISSTIVAKRVAANYDLICIVTLGKEGIVACLPDGVIEMGSLPVDAVDTTAAGDAFVGVLAANLDEGIELPLALKKAVVAGGLACLTRGAQVSLPSQQDIEDNLKNLPAPRRSA